MDDLLDTAPCGFLSFADDGTITLANSTLAMVGHDRDSLPRPEPREDADGRGPALLPEALLPPPKPKGGRRGGLPNAPDRGGGRGPGPPEPRPPRARGDDGVRLRRLPGPPA